MARISSVSFAESLLQVANIISKVVGRTTMHVVLSPQQLHNQMIPDGLPRVWVVTASEIQQSTSKESEENVNNVICKSQGSIQKDLLILEKKSSLYGRLYGRMNFNEELEKQLLM
ncbi:predicted protein [Sclerotinia sclerotiorum 1980 UF-70]|uniref:Uncharacterized protein n=2 Tax=Sclerotinia sclerotiorum (strain ATCC 18683 / 1980 / Ss-1) TaxID=665079 RepID=A7F587_SCLS1|nr:predicted protein [Sclerotinia sclerotiorum 1980 UF-70]APA06535.1 hypothetical protein sscle_02g013050 [Sclerotinia sclerotiorum 1980 UF-70]EDN97908.1 predicted protein [Sclerotinia sclerotiorum 1980 UF-70]